jgi:hypothetical protein
MLMKEPTLVVYSIKPAWIPAFAGMANDKPSPRKLALVPIEGEGLGHTLAMTFWHNRLLGD